MKKAGELRWKESVGAWACLRTLLKQKAGIFRKMWCDSVMKNLLFNQLLWDSLTQSWCLACSCGQCPVFFLIFPALDGEAFIQCTHEFASGRRTLRWQPWTARISRGFQALIYASFTPSPYKLLLAFSPGANSSSVKDQPKICLIVSRLPLALSCRRWKDFEAQGERAPHSELSLWGCSATRISLLGEAMYYGCCISFHLPAISLSPL